MNLRTVRTLEQWHLALTVLDEMSPVTPAATPLASAHAAGSRASYENMICVASPAGFLSLGVLGPAGRFPTMPLTRFRIRWATRGESFPRQFGAWQRMALRKAGAGAMRLLRRGRRGPVWRGVVPPCLTVLKVIVAPF